MISKGAAANDRDLTMSKALGELMLRHGQTMPSQTLVALSEPSLTPMLLSGQGVDHRC
jgi:hypothetical protein